MTLVEYIYIASAALFILSLRGMSEVKTSRMGNIAGALGLLLAVVATLLAVRLERFDLIALAVAIGAVIGVPMALKMPMTAVPQRTAISHAFGALAAALVGTAEYYSQAPGVGTFTMAVLSAEVILGYLTFTGSVVAFAKLQELMPGRPLIYPGRRFISMLVIGATFAIGAALTLDPSQTFLFPFLIALSLIFGFLLVIAIGGADMPTVIAILNSFAGLSAAGLGFVLNNKLLIVAGSLDGSSGLILSILMCRAMNRSFANVLFGGFGAAPQLSQVTTDKPIQAIDVEETGTLLGFASSVVFVPGYGMAVAQAQHAVSDLATLLEEKGIDVSFAIHPVAGRMPGHMNVLLAEADVPYERLHEMEEVNRMIETVDVAIVIGANDVVNPAAKEDKGSPIYGMPIIEVDRAKTCIVLKRSMNPGFAGIENPLFFKPATRMLFGDAKASLQALAASFKAQE